jgi:hypothetical protein
VSRRRRGIGNRGSEYRWLLQFLVANGSQLGDGARGCTEEEARHEAVARYWRHRSPAVVAASGAGARDGVERGKEEESDFASSMDHNGKGIRVTGRLEVVGSARGREKPRRRETRGSGGPVGVVAPSDAARCAMGDFPRWALGQTTSGRFDVGLGNRVKEVNPFNPFPKF